MKRFDIQLDSDNQLRHFLTIEGLKKQMLLDILDNAENFSSVSNRQVKKSAFASWQNHCQFIL